MQRRRPLRRSPFRRRPLDTAPRASGRPATSRIEWEAIQSQVRTRAGWRCQACGRRSRLDVHHVIKRSRGGSDFDLDRLVALCRRCHDQTDAPLVAGRLTVTPLGDGRFTFEVVHGPAKYRWPSVTSPEQTARNVAEAMRLQPPYPWSSETIRRSERRTR